MYVLSKKTKVLLHQIKEQRHCSTKCTHVVHQLYFYHYHSYSRYYYHEAFGSKANCKRKVKNGPFPTGNFESFDHNRTRKIKPYLEALRLLAEERRERLSDKAEAQRRHKDSQGQRGGGLKGVSQKSVDHDMKSMLIRFFGCCYLKYMVLKCWILVY